MGQCAIAAQVGQTRAETANGKGDKLLGMWDESGNNIYHKNSSYRINNVNFGYSNLDHKLLAGTNINIDNDYKINSTLPIAGIGSLRILGGVRVDGTSITINPTTGVISGANT